MKTVVTERAKIAALFKEKDWLSKHVRQADIECVLVQCIDPEILIETAFWVDGIKWERRFLLHNVSGELVLEVGISSVPRPPFCYCKPWTWMAFDNGSVSTDNQETIAEALLRCDEKVFYITKLEHNPDTFIPSSIELTLYKPPKSFDLEQWLEEIHARALTSLRDELAVIDAMA